MQHFNPTTAATTTALPLVAARGNWNEIARLTQADGSTLNPSAIIDGFMSALPSEFADYDRKGRGSSVSLDLYGYDPAQNVAIIQIRNAFRRAGNHFLNVRKDYVLVGYNENGKPFRHPISAAAVHGAIRKDGADPVATVRGAQAWMWEVSAAKLASGIRQGDVLIVPERGRPSNAETVAETVVLVNGTHEVSAGEFVRNGKGILFAKGPTVRHTKGQHATACGDNDGWHSIRAGREAASWELGRRLSD